MVRGSEPVRVVWTKGFIIKIRLPKLLELMKNFFRKVVLFVCGGGHPEITSKAGLAVWEKTDSETELSVQNKPPPPWKNLR